MPAKLRRAIPIRQRRLARPNALRNREGKMTSRRVVVALALACIAPCPATAQQIDISTGSVVETVANLRLANMSGRRKSRQAADAANRELKNSARHFVPKWRAHRRHDVSTGRPGHSTPTGVFTILQKQIEHYSSKYDSAPMPYMERITWYGVALHAGHLPGYPASHGCIRMPLVCQTALRVTGLGMTVVIADAAATPRVRRLRAAFRRGRRQQ